MQSLLNTRVLKEFSLLAQHEVSQHASPLTPSPSLVAQSHPSVRAKLNFTCGTEAAVALRLKTCNTGNSFFVNTNTGKSASKELKPRPHLGAIQLAA